MTLTLIQGHSGSPESKHMQRWIISITNQIINIKLATTVGTFLYDLDCDFENIYMAWAFCFIITKSNQKPLSFNKESLCSQVSIALKSPLCFERPMSEILLLLKNFLAPLSADQFFSIHELFPLSSWVFQMNKADVSSIPIVLFKCPTQIFPQYLFSYLAFWRSVCRVMFCFNNQNRCANVFFLSSGFFRAFNHIPCIHQLQCFSFSDSHSWFSKSYVRNTYRTSI